MGKKRYKKSLHTFLRKCCDPYTEFYDFQDKFIMTTLAICNLLLQGTFTPNSMRSYLMSKDIKSKEIYNYARVCARMVRNAEGVYTPAILEVMNLLSRDDFSRKLPKTYKQMLRCMIGWMKCQEFGSNFNLFVNWSNFDPDVPDVWYTPQDYIDGNCITSSYFVKHSL